MMESQHAGPPPDKPPCQINDLVDEFDESWHRVRHGGSRPDIHSVMKHVPSEWKAWCLTELLAIELEYRAKANEHPSRDEYINRFPDNNSAIEKAFLEHDAAVKQFRPSPNGQNGRSRFAARLNCPHCQNPIEIVSVSVDEEVVCPSCGSSLTVDTGRALTWDKQKLPQIAEFELLEAVGRGAFGTVYKARDQKLQRIVAIKIPRSGVLATDEDEDRFVREARNVAQLRHPGIVAIHSVGRSEAFPYLVSEFAEGVTLSQYLTAKRFSISDAARLIRDAALALHHAHERGVVHRDLKPSNIMFAPDNTPRLMDFGFAKRDAGEITMTLDGQILGTPAYMSPEQARGQSHEADARSDIYSLGVILFQLLTGELPFRGDVRMLLHQVVHDEAPSPYTLNHHVPRDVATITLKCLSKDPKRRYGTSAELADDLARWLDGRPILARPVGQAERFWRWCRRNPVIASLSASIVLVLSIGMTISWFFADQASRRANELATKQSELVKKQSELAEETKRANRKADEANENARLAQRHLYAADMNLAQLHWENNAVSLVFDRLDRHRPKPDATPMMGDLRGFEWYYWERLCHSSLLDLKGHTHEVVSVAFSPDGQRLASASFGTVRLWDTDTGLESLTLKEHTGMVRSVAFSPDGQRLASASDDKMVKVWDANTGQELRTLKGHTHGVFSVAFSPDGQRLASASSDKTVKVWNATMGQESLTLKGHNGAVYTVAFSADGQRLVSASYDRTVKVWDANTGQELLTLKGHTSFVNDVAFSPNGQRLVSASYDRTVKVWDANTGQESLTLRGHTGGVNRVVFSPDGQRLASASNDQTVKVWDANTGQESLTLKGHTSSVESVAFSPDGQRLASASIDKTVKVWDANAGQESLMLKGHTDWVHSVSFSPDGQRLASASGDIRQPGEVKVWDATTGHESLTLKGHTGEVYSVTFSPDGQRLASASADKTVKVWDATTGEESLTLKGHTGGVTSVAFSPDRQRLASASADKTVKVWDANTGQELLTLKGNTSFVKDVAFSPDGQRLASVSFGTVRLWDANTGHESLTLKGHTGGVTSVAFSPDGQRLASASEDRAVKVWDATTGHESLTLKGHTSGVNRVAFSPDGQRLASASGDGTVKVWDATTGHESLTLKGHTGQVMSVAFSPDGQQLASASEDKTVKVWDSRPWMPELRAEREAFSVIRGLQAQGKPQGEWLDAIAANHTLSDPVRKRAQQLAREWKESVTVQGSNENTVSNVIEYSAAQWYDAMSVLLAAGKLAKYRDACRMCAADIKARNLGIDWKDRLFYAGVPVADSGLSAEEIAKLGEEVANAFRVNNAGYAARIHGAALYRGQKYAQSADTFAKSLEAGWAPHAWDYCFYAMAVHRTGDNVKARQLLQKARDWISKSTVLASENVEQSLLLKEATELIGE